MPGVIACVEGDVARVMGLDEIAAGDEVRCAGGARGVAMLLHRDHVSVALLDRSPDLAAGAPVESAGALSVPVGDALRGRIVDALGRPIDGSAAIPDLPARRLQARTASISARAPVQRSLITGIKAVETLLPLGLGQSAAFVGPPGTGKTDLLLTATIAQRGSNRRCFFCAVGAEPRELSRVAGVLRNRGGLDHTTIIAAPVGSPPAMRVLAPFAAMAMAEHELDAGHDAIVAIDGMAAHAEAFRSLVAGLHHAVPPEAEVFSGEAALLDRARQLDACHGGGSISVLITLESSSETLPHAPTNIAYAVDRVCWLDGHRFRIGQRPALVPPAIAGKLVSGGYPPLKGRPLGTLRLRIAEGELVRRWVDHPGAAEPAEDTRRAVARADHLLELLVQPPSSPVRLDLVVALTLASESEAFYALPRDRIRSFEHALDAGLTAASLVIPPERRLDPPTTSALQRLIAQAMQEVAEAGQRG